MQTIDQIMQLSGPFTTDGARRRYRGHLAGLSPDKQAKLLADLQSSMARTGSKYKTERPKLDVCSV